jgi:hypothetical protein
MALEGTLRDFSLADIFQLIGLQRKTGVLTLAGPMDTVSIPFEKGRIVGADSESKRLEDRLGYVLQKTGKIDGHQLDRVLRLQRETGRRIGDLLVQEATLSPEDLGRALELQITQIIYRLFRWSEGEFRFAQTSSVEYDRQFFRPIPVETVLMEGLRILDEWPLIERRVRSFNLVYAPTDPSRDVREEGPGDSAVEDRALDAALGLASETTDAGSSQSPDPDTDLVTVSPHEYVVYRLTDGQRTVQDIIDRSDLGEFETCKSLFALLETELIREVSRHAEKGQDHAPRRAVGDRALALVVALLGAGLLLSGVWWTVQTPRQRLLGPFRVAEAVDTLCLSASLSRMARLEFAVRLYAFYRGEYPDSLDALVSMGLVAPRDLLDPWGKSYSYIVSRRSFQLRGRDGEGREHPNLILTGRLAQNRPADTISEPGGPSPR